MPEPNDPRDFYERVYEVVRWIPPGQVTNYGHIAVILGSPSAARAVGYALYNLLPGTDDVPWWRVLKANGGIAYKGRGTQADLQRTLLEREGIPFDDAGHVSFATHRWWPEE